MRKALTIFIILITVIPASAQYFYRSTEYGIAAGGSQYFGDLNENYGFNTPHAAGGIFVREHLNHYIAIKAVLNYTKVSYDDKFSDNPYNKARNLNFASDVIEFGFQTEFNFFKFATGEQGHRFTPYLTGGLSAFYYNPYTTLNGEKFYLRPLGTEGQNVGMGTKYSTFSLCIPVGAGVKYWLKPGVNVSLELADRLTMTDYLDDVSTTYAGASHFTGTALALQDRSGEIAPDSPLGRAGKQRGNAATKDQYVMFLATISFQFKTYRCPTPNQQY